MVLLLQFPFVPLPFLYAEQISFEVVEWSALYFFVSKVMQRVRTEAHQINKGAYSYFSTPLAFIPAFLFILCSTEKRKRKRVGRKNTSPPLFKGPLSLLSSFSPSGNFSFKKKRGKRKLRPRQEKALFKSGLARKRSAKIAEIKI